MPVPAGKIAVPHLPPEFVPRPAVRERLDRAAPTDLVVVSAPAGYGKSVVLADWARHHATEVAWVTLDATDNDRARLWSAVRAALRSCAAVPATSALHGSQSGRDQSDLVDEVIAAVDELDRPVWLVLDDVHELISAESLHDLARLLRLRPNTLRPVLASRIDPPLALPRARVEGRLHEVRAEHLRFSSDETRTLLRSSELTLTPDQLDTLLIRTEGWVAGLRLAIFALRHADDPGRFLAEFSGDDRSVAGYLAGEMLSGLDPETLDFARAVSVCSLLSTELAAELSGRPDAGRLLDRLGHTTALVARTGPREHRIHALLRSYLLAHLQRRSPRRYRELEARAARWWESHNEPVHALRHAERAGDEALLGEVLQRSAVGMLLRGELEALRHGLVAVGTTARRADPALALPAAITHLALGAWEAAAAELEHARLAWPAAPSPGLAALRTSAELLASAQGIDVTASGPPPAAIDDDGLDDAELEALLHVSRGAALLTHSTDRVRARGELERALALSRTLGLPFLEVHTLTLLAALASAEGDGRAMVQFAQGALAAGGASGNPPSAMSAAPSSFLAYADLLGGDPTAAGDRAAEALRIQDRLSPDVAFTLHAVHGAARADRGEGVAGLAEMHAARMRYDGNEQPPEFFAALAVLEQRTAVMLGNLGAAAAVVAWLEQRTGPIGEILLMRAWAEAAAGRHESASSLVVPLLKGAEPMLLTHTPLEVSLLCMESELRAADSRAARASLRSALAMGRSLDVVRPFALVGAESRAMLAGWIASSTRDRFATRIARALTTVRPESSAPLSERETAVLALLPSLLSAREIAAELTVSVNTVKTHIRAIYVKLGVASRREAVRRAQERNLLP